MTDKTKQNKMWAEKNDDDEDDEKKKGKEK